MLNEYFDKITSRIKESTLYGNEFAEFLDIISRLINSINNNANNFNNNINEINEINGISKVPNFKLKSIDNPQSNIKYNLYLELLFDVLYLKHHLVPVKKDKILNKWFNLLTLEITSRIQSFADGINTDKLNAIVQEKSPTHQLMSIKMILK